MAQLTLDDKREITRRLGYRLEAPEGGGRGALYDPDGRHKGLFLACKATDVWTWNEAVFRYRLHRHREGGVWRRVDPQTVESRTGLYAQVWPEVGEAAMHERGDFVELGGADRAA